LRLWYNPTVHESSPLVTGIRLENLKPEVRSYVQKLRASLQVIYDKYEVANRDELAAKVRTGIVKQEDITKALELMSVINDCGRKNEIVSWAFEAPLIQEEEERLEEFFGEHFDVPPIPEGITHEHLNFWKENGFKLQYWPKIKMKEDAKYPGWTHKPGKRHTPGKQYGIEFYNELDKIKNLPENTANTNLTNLEPEELPGVWMLVDSRKKPNYDNGNQSYVTEEQNDALIQDVLKQLLKDKVLNQEASKCLRNKIHSKVFSNSKFWEAFKQALKLDDIPNATVRLPRTIEANVMGQGPDYNDTFTHEWHEEYYEFGSRLVSGRSDRGGTSYVSWEVDPHGLVGFRPLVVFSRQ